MVSKESLGAKDISLGCLFREHCCGYILPDSRLLVHVIRELFIVWRHDVFVFWVLSVEEMGVEYRLLEGGDRGWC